MSANIFLVLMVGAVASAVTGVPVEEYDLKFVVFVHRHGDRSPVSTYPTDPYGNVSLWNNGWGELTNEGKRNAYNLGRWIRKRYDDFLPKIYASLDYEVQSTDVSRTLMSAYLVLAGLYDPIDSDIWNPELKWQPIPVHTTPRNLDNVLAASKPCPRHSQLLTELMLSSEMTSKLKNMEPELSEVVKYAGYNNTFLLTNFLLSGIVYDSLFVQNHNGYPLPNWTVSYFPQPLEEWGLLNLQLPTYTRDLQRLSCGLLTKNILDNLKAKSKGKLTKKMWQYSAHDITIVGLTQCLNLPQTVAPSYASSLFIELRSKNDEYFVSILYRNDDKLQTLVIPGCSEYCPLGKFEELVKPVIPKNWEEECRRIDN